MIKIRTILPLGFITGILLTGLLSSAQAAPQSANVSSSNTVYQSWHDNRRGRDIPVKIYLPTSGNPPFPVVIFSHGLGGSTEAAQYLGKYWSEHGYFCLFVQHAGSDSQTWKPFAAEGGQAMRAHMKEAANPKNAIDRVGDIKFALDKLEDLNARDPQFKGQLQLNRIALSGHSFGAGTTLAVAGQKYTQGSFCDRRIKAAIYLCPPISKAGNFTTRERYSDIKIPGLLLTGTRDDSPINDTKAVERRVPFDNIQSPHQYLVNFDGADHAVFGGRAMRPAEPGDEKFHAMIDVVTLKFLDAYLRDDPQAQKWLDTEAVTNYLGKTAVFERK